MTVNLLPFAGLGIGNYEDIINQQTQHRSTTVLLRGILQELKNGFTPYQVLIHESRNVQTFLRFSSSTTCNQMALIIVTPYCESTTIYVTRKIISNKHSAFSCLGNHNVASDRHITRNDYETRTGLTPYRFVTQDTSWWAKRHENMITFVCSNSIASQYLSVCRLWDRAEGRNLRRGRRNNHFKKIPPMNNEEITETWLFLSIC